MSHIWLLPACSRWAVTTVDFPVGWFTSSLPGQTNNRPPLHCVHMSICLYVVSLFPSVFVCASSKMNQFIQAAQRTETFVCAILRVCARVQECTLEGMCLLLHAYACTCECVCALERACVRAWLSASVHILFPASRCAMRSLAGCSSYQQLLEVAGLSLVCICTDPFYLKLTTAKHISPTCVATKKTVYMCVRAFLTLSSPAVFKAFCVYVWCDLLCDLCYTFHTFADLRRQPIRTSVFLLRPENEKLPKDVTNDK